jgi:hypothetical protein
VDLGDMVLDIHEGTRDRQRIARDLGATLDEAEQGAEHDTGRLHRRLVDRVQRLSKHVSALHVVHEPWGLTPFAVQSALLGIPEETRTPVRLPAPEITPAPPVRSPSGRRRRQLPGYRLSRPCPPARWTIEPATAGTLDHRAGYSRHRHAVRPPQPAVTVGSNDPEAVPEVDR